MFNVRKWVENTLVQFRDLGEPGQRFNVEYIGSKMGQVKNAAYQVGKITSFLKKIVEKRQIVPPLNGA